MEVYVCLESDYSGFEIEFVTPSKEEAETWAEQPASRKYWVRYAEKTTLKEVA